MEPLSNLKDTKQNQLELEPLDLDFFDLPDEHPPIPEGEEDLCRALWLSVIVQVVSDATSNRSRPCFKRDRECALRWIHGETSKDREDFRLVCDLAGVDPDQMRRAIELALGSEDHGFNFRCLLKHACGTRQRNPESRKSYFRRLRRKAGRNLCRKNCEKSKRELVH